MTSPQSPTTTALRADPLLDRYFDNEKERLELTRQLFNQAAVHYDRAESITGLGSGSWYRRDVLRRNGLRPGMRILDVAAGTGLVSCEAQRIVGEQGQVIALDPSPGMLAELKKKLDVETIEAFAEAIPLTDDQVDFVSMGYALRHVADLPRAFAEYQRVLRPGGQVCIMEISRPASRLGQAALRFYLGRLVPFLMRRAKASADASLLWEYYGDTVQAALDPEAVMAAMRQAGLVEVSCSVTLGIFREYLGRKAESGHGL